MIYTAPSVDAEPVVSLMQWRVYEASLGEEPVTQHLIGFQLPFGSGRVSTEICDVDNETRMVRTRSGRKYSLVGSSGFNSDAQYVWDVWSRVNRATKFRDVTAEFEALLASPDVLLGDQP